MCFRKIVWVLAIVGISFSCRAVIKGATAVKFSGTVVNPPNCILNNNELIEVQFGTVGIRQADGRQVIKPLNYNLKCSGSDGGKSLKMQFAGTQGFAADVLATSIDGLGVRFYHNGEAVTLQEWFSLPKPASKLVLTASPIADPRVEPAGGDFQASATLLLAFQ
ncbi:fimbrial protein [Erwinia aphidicola]|uniref:fimbrial protein n=1 Tax=Erwinia aphidicola TaxID=68334 RepID=UPI003015D317